MLKGEIFITKVDREKLVYLLERARSLNFEDRMLLKKLEDELRRAHIVDQKEIPAELVTMNSKVRIEDVDTGEEDVITVVFPGHANYQEGKVSVLAPIGTALLGYRVDDVIEWEMPRGFRRLKVKEILYQPEANNEDLA
jgi:regulator of nucleoside diphosphate kinase